MPPNQNRTRTRKRSAGGFLFGLFTGVVIGLAVSLGIAFYLQPHASAVHAAKPKAEKEPEAAGHRRPAADRHCADYRAGEAEVRLLQDPARTEEPVHRARAARAAARQPRRSTGSLQGRLFHSGRVVPEPADADNQKARPAILGFESSVEAGQPARQGTWYRVRMGPYQKLDEIQPHPPVRLRRTASRRNLVKIKEPQ